MRILNTLDDIPQFENTVITLGSFDGIHKAHRKIIKRIISLAKEIEGISIVVSFDRHPREIIFPKDDSLRFLTTNDEKIRHLTELGVDYLVFLPFTVELSQMDPREYLEKIIIEKFKPSYIVVGYDHRFGLNRAGDYSLIEEYGEKFGFKTIQISKLEIEEITISSTKIRNALSEGRLEEANFLLGYNYSFSGKVVYGEQIGTTIGFPTANIEIANKKKLVPAKGIYACKVHLDKLCYQGMLYIGNKSTVTTSQNAVIEVHILDFNQDIYHKVLDIEILHLIREDQHFESLTLLKAQIQNDEIIARDFFNSADNTLIRHKVNVVILNYNGVDFLESYLPSIQYSCSDDFKITVIDNASTDDSVAFLEEWYPEIELVILPKNYGFAEGYNRGTKDLDNEYLVLLNSDVEVTEHWLDTMIEFMDNNPHVAVTSPKVLSMEKKNTFEHAGAAGGFMDSLAYPFCRGRIFESCEIDENQYDTPIEMFWATGAAFVIRNSVWKNFGGFDGSYFAHMEEIDLCWRIKRAGYSIINLPLSTVYHLGGGTLAYDNPQKVYLNFRNGLITLIKNESGSALFYKFPLRLVLDGIAGLYFLFQGKPKNLFSITRSHFSVYGKFRTILRNRKNTKSLIQKYRLKEANMKGKISSSVLFGYYLFGKRKFTDYQEE